MLGTKPRIRSALLLSMPLQLPTSPFLFFLMPGNYSFNKSSVGSRMLLVGAAALKIVWPGGEASSPRRHTSAASRASI